MKMESLQQRREELERKEYQLKESLLKFDKFLKVCKFVISPKNALSETYRKMMKNANELYAKLRLRKKYQVIRKTN